MKTSDKTRAIRRDFLKISASGAVGALAASGIATAEKSGCEQHSQSGKTETRHRIRRLSLQTASPLSDMAAYYKDVLEMPVQLTEQKLMVQAGETQITFSPAEGGSKPYYHFAFNIPENKILSARKWLGARTKLSVTPASNREKGLPNDIMPFNHWNSHSLFFLDPAGNILELICRHDLKNGTKGEFRHDEILYASEIGFVTNGSVTEFAEQIKSTFHLSQYRGGGDGFRAIGDEHGLLILFRRGGTPVGAKDGQSWQVFPTEVDVRPDILLEHEHLPHSISTS